MIHQTADVQSQSIGSNTFIWQFVVVLKDARIGDNCNINSHVFIENDVCIGNRVTIKSGVQLWDGIIIKDDVFVGPNVTFTNDLLPRSKVYPSTFSKTTIEEGASIGANATVLTNIKIGKKAMIGAGAVVTKNVPPHTIWYGNPAKHKGYITAENNVLDLNLFDKKNQTQYLLQKNGEPIKK